MTVWMLALLLLGTFAAIGHNQGAIRVGISFVGLLTAALLALPLTPLLKPVFPPVGITSPLLIWVLSPFVIFLVVVILFEVVGQTVHHKVNVYYKYQGADLQLGRWQRLNHQLGLCLGLVSGAVWLLLISLVIYSSSFLTTQTTATEREPMLIRLLNRAGRDLQTTGMAGAVAAIDPLPAAYYAAADVAGVVYHNPLVQGRLSRYPALLGLSERPEFQAIATDKNYLEMLQQGRPLAEVVGHVRSKAILRNPQLLRETWSLLLPDLKDLREFLETGKSAKYDGEKILGRWTFDANATITALKKTRPNLTSAQLQYYKLTIFPLLAKMALTITPDQHALVKNFVRIKFSASPPHVSEPQTLQGRWQHSGGDAYHLALGEGGKTENLEALVEDGRLTISGETMPLVLEKEN